MRLLSRRLNEADTAAVAASLSAWERGSVGADGTPLADKASIGSAATDASPYVAQFLRRLSGISAPGSATKASPAANTRGASARKSAKTTITPHKTSTGALSIFSPKVSRRSTASREFAIYSLLSCCCADFVTLWLCVFYALLLPWRAAPTADGAKQAVYKHRRIILPLQDRN